MNVGQLKTQWGDVHPVTLYLLDLEIENQLFPAIIVAGDAENDEIILGRNILNKLALLLDGPQQSTQTLSDVILWRLRT